MTTFDTTTNLQRKSGIDTKIKAIERKLQHNVSIREKVVIKVVKNSCTNIISLF